MRWIVFGYSLTTPPEKRIYTLDAKDQREAILAVRKRSVVVEHCLEQGDVIEGDYTAQFVGVDEINIENMNTKSGIITYLLNPRSWRMSRASLIAAILFLALLAWLCFDKRRSSQPVDEPRPLNFDPR